MFRILPKEDKYFEMFNCMASHMTECALLLQKIFSDFDNRAAYADKIKEVEHECDVIIHELTSGLDDVVDTIEYTAKRVILYRVEEPTDHARKMSDVVVRIVTRLENAVRSLENNGEQVLKECVTIHGLENEGDVYHHEAVDDLFGNETNPITILKMKELYAKMERTIDKCEDVSNVLEAIVLKNA